MGSYNGMVVRGYRSPVRAACLIHIKVIISRARLYISHDCTCRIFDLDIFRRKLLHTILSPPYQCSLQPCFSLYSIPACSAEIAEEAFSCEEEAFAICKRGLRGRFG